MALTTMKFSDEKDGIFSKYDNGSNVTTISANGVNVRNGVVCFNLQVKVTNVPQGAWTKIGTVSKAPSNEIKDFFMLSSTGGFGGIFRLKTTGDVELNATNGAISDEKTIVLNTVYSS